MYRSCRISSMLVLLFLYSVAMATDEGIFHFRVFCFDRVRRKENKKRKAKKTKLIASIISAMRTRWSVESLVHRTRPPRWKTQGGEYGGKSSLGLLSLSHGYLLLYLKYIYKKVKIISTLWVVYTWSCARPRIVREQDSPPGSFLCTFTICLLGSRIFAINCVD